MEFDSIGWMLVWISYFLMGVYGLVSARAGTTKTVVDRIWLVSSPLGALGLAGVLNIVAHNLFLKAELANFDASGTITEEQMQPDFPNLLTGLLMIGLPCFLAGFLVGRLRDRKEGASAENQCGAGE